MTQLQLILLLAVGLSPLMGGCGATSGSRTSEVPLETRQNLVYLDRKLLANIPCDHLDAQKLASGRLHVLARFQNKQNQTAEVQVKLKFRDAAGNSVDETSWMPLLLPRRELTEFQHTCLSTTADDFTLMVRIAK
jgi:uncharacterized protein YcfL